MPRKYTKRSEYWESIKKKEAPIIYGNGKYITYDFDGTLFISKNLNFQNFFN